MIGLSVYVFFPYKINVNIFAILIYFRFFLKLQILLVNNLQKFTFLKDNKEPFVLLYFRFVHFFFGTHVYDTPRL